MQGLTARQAELMDILWDCNDMEAVIATIQALPRQQDRIDAANLVKIARLDSYELGGGLDQYADIAQDIIDRASLR